MSLDDYLSILKPTEARLYEIANHNCGKNLEWQIQLKELHKRTGLKSPLSKFRAVIEKLIVSGHFPDYEIRLLKSDLVSFTRLMEDESISSQIDDSNNPHPLLPEYYQ